MICKLQNVFHFLVNERIHRVNENQTLTVAVKMMNLHWKQCYDAKVKGFNLGNLTGVCFHAWHQCFIWGWTSVPGIRELALIQLFHQSSIWTTGIPAPSWKRNHHNRRHWPPLNLPHPQIEWHPFNCLAKTEMEQEIKEDVAPWSCAKSAPSPSFPRMECWRIEGL